jgi:type III secretory pathway component EscV
MKKIFAVFISLTLIFLLGCSFEKEKVNEDKNIKETTNEKEQASEKENVEETTDAENDNTNEYEEISKIAEKINVQDYNMNVESDNEGTRIILFEKNGIKMYKSIFVKAKKHLKLIDLESGEKPLINETI